jgi:hypothetical protein
MLGAGKGLEGMAQSLSQFIARRGEKRERDEERAYRSKRDLAEDAYRNENLGLQRTAHANEQAYREGQQKQAALRDDRDLIEKVLSGLSGPRAFVPKETADKAKEVGFGAYIHDSTPFEAPFFNPNNPLGGVAMTQEDAGQTASPLIPAAVRAQMSAVNNKNDQFEATLAQKAAELAAKESNWNAQNTLRGQALLLQGQNLDLQRALADLQARQKGAGIQAGVYESALQQALAEAKEKFSEMDVMFDPRLRQARDQFLASRTEEIMKGANAAMTQGASQFQLPGPATNPFTNLPPQRGRMPKP